MSAEIESKADKIMSFHFEVPFGYDCYLEETEYYRIFKKELESYEPSISLPFDYHGYHLAIKIFTDRVIHISDGFSPNENYKERLNSAITGFNSTELLEIVDYLGIFKNISWNDKKDCFINDFYYTTDKLDYSTVVDICSAVLYEVVNGYLLQIETILKLTKSQDFWIELLYIQTDNDGKLDEDERRRLENLLNSIFK